MSVDSVSRLNFEELYKKVLVQTDSLTIPESGFNKSEKAFQDFIGSFQKRIDQLNRHVGYFDLLTEDSAKSKIAFESDETLMLSDRLESDYQKFLSGLIRRSNQLEKEYSSTAEFNSIGILCLFLLSTILVVINFYLGRKQEKLVIEKKINQANLEIAKKDALDFQNAFEFAAIGMGLVNETGRWIKVNQSLCSMLGYSEEELLKLTFQEITHPDDLFADLDQVKKLSNREIESYTIEKRYITKSGEILWINLNGSAVWEEDGRLRHYIAQIENITPRKTSFQYLEDQKNRFENVIKGTHAGIWEWNVQTGQTIFNETWANFIGYSLLELEPVSIETWVKYAHPEDVEESNRRLQKCFSRESELYECECRMRHKDGHWVWVLARGKVMSWTPEGKPEKMFGTHLDISQFKNLEDELLRKEAFIRTILDTIDVGVVACDSKGVLTMFNKATKDFHGLDSKEISPSEWSKYYNLYEEDGITPLDQENIPLFRAWKGERVENQVICIKNNSGKVYYLSSSGSQFRDEIGRIQGAVVAMKDITDSRRITQEIEKSERKFKGIFNSTFQFIGFLEPDGTLLEANQTALDFAGLVQEDVVGKKFWDCFWWQISPETQQNLQHSVRRAAKGEFVQYEVAVWDKDKNPVTILFNLKPLFDADGKVVAIIPEGRLIQDIVNARRALELKNEELERFASVASHDLKEPLRMVVNFLQLLEKKYKGQLDAKADQYIHFAVDASQRMNNLISDLLEYSKLGNENTEVEDIDLDKLIQDQQKYFASLLKECNGKIIYSSLSPITGKMVPFTMLVRNLIGNAVKYRKEDVPLKISIVQKEFPNHWEFAISDNGIGFDPGQADRIFEMFKRLHTRQKYAGTGLGLAICKKIVEQHEGRIWAKSNPGEGSTFYFTISKMLSENRNYKLKSEVDHLVNRSGSNQNAGEQNSLPSYKEN